MHLIPESWSHLHMLVSVFPSVGLLIVMVVYVSAQSMNNEGMKRVCLALLGILGVLAIPTYFSGTGSAGEVANNPRFSPAAIAVHLNLSVKTVETHRANIMRRLSCHSVSDLVVYAIRNEIVRI